MKLRVQNIQGLSPNFTVTIDEDSDMAFKGGAELRVEGSQSALPLPFGTTNAFAARQITHSPRRGYENGELRYNLTTQKLEVFNNGVWSG
tara:strand:+ start:888 stop:1157 length:270 start_codon:yes stop_codon:yes gene_type:complete